MSRQVRRRARGHHQGVFQYYYAAHAHLSLERNSPIPREVEPASRGKVISLPQVGGLHHRYARAA